jgi:hypothetical protein
MKWHDMLFIVFLMTQTPAFLLFLLSFMTIYSVIALIQAVADFFYRGERASLFLLFFVTLIFFHVKMSFLAIIPVF